MGAAEEIGKREANEYVSIPPTEFLDETEAAYELRGAWLRGWNYQKHKNVLRGTGK